MIAQAMPVIVWLLPVVGLLVGGALLARSGLRGRQLDNHPICRRCGFDLYGSFRSEICPECGSAITRANVRLGNYERRPARAAAGIFLMLPAATVLAAVGVAAARGVQWDHHKPLWLLLREGDTRALMELERRRAASLLTPAQVNAVVERALAIQRDRRRPWLAEWGDFVERVAAGGACRSSSGGGTRGRRSTTSWTRTRWPARRWVCSCASGPTRRGWARAAGSTSTCASHTRRSPACRSSDTRRTAAAGSGGGT